MKRWVHLKGGGGGVGGDGGGGGDGVCVCVGGGGLIQGKDLYARPHKHGGQE